MGSLQCLQARLTDSNEILTKKSKINKETAIEDIIIEENNPNKVMKSIENPYFQALNLQKEAAMLSNKPHDDSDFGVCRPGCIRRDSFSDVYNRLLDGNKLYTKEKIQEDPEYFIKRAKDQKPKYLLIGCSDSRVPPNEITKTNPGEIFIHRNIANQVIHSDLNCMSVIQYAVEYLNVEHVIIMGHTKCGGILASKIKTFKGLIENWIQNIKDVAYLNKDELQKCTTENEYFDKLTVLNVRHQVWNVCKTSFVQKAWANGKNLHIHGWLTDIETGIIKDLKMNNQDWNVIKDYYDFSFK